jgi:UDP-N-acetylmuramate dehydrogenase
MNIEENVSLAAYSTIRLGGAARYLAEVKSEDDLQKLVQWAKPQNLPVIMIGRGSNIVWRDEGFPGLVLVNKIMGRKVLKDEDHTATIKLGGGENWDAAVDWTVGKKLSGLEYMSLVPGTVGAAPVQNVGAYGGELSDTLLELEAYDATLSSFVKLQNHDCNFSYRSSRFKTTDKGRFFITSITVTLKKREPLPPFYEALQNYFDEHGTTKYPPKAIRQAVIAIRQAKLPDPEKVSNNGSFFTNPVIELAQFQQLMQRYPDIKGWETKEGKMKVSAGWLVEKAGFRGVHDEQTGMATWPAQALVLVNEHARRTSDLLEFRQKIIFKVDELFDIVLQQEPELLP